MTASLSAPVAAESAPEAIDLNQFLALPDTQPANEFINGKIIQKPMPQGEFHRIICSSEAFIQMAKSAG